MDLEKMVEDYLPEEVSKQLAKLKNGLKLGCG